MVFVLDDISDDVHLFDFEVDSLFFNFGLIKR